MKSSKFWIAVLVAGVVINVFDYVLHGIILRDMYTSDPTTFRQMENPTWFVIGDFVAVLVLAWFYDKVYGSFSGGMKGGMVFGIYAGILVGFPGFIFTHLVFNGFTYGMAWTWIITGIIWGGIAGAILGALYKKGEAKAAA
jgi:hypothetical protein